MVIVNYAIKNKDIIIKRYQSEGRDVVLYDKNRIAVMDDALDEKDDLTIMYFKGEPLPFIISQKQADEINEASKLLEEEKIKEDGADG